MALEHLLPLELKLCAVGGVIYRIAALRGQETRRRSAMQVRECCCSM
jgi:hypothetical protein